MNETKGSPQDGTSTVSIARASRCGRAACFDVCSVAFPGSLRQCQHLPGVHDGTCRNK